MTQERLDEFKPTRYFITYDFETVPRIINQRYRSKSVVNGIEVHNSQQHTVLEPLSVASTIKSKYENKKICFDLRQESFIEKWLEQMFEEAKQLKEDNQYDDPEIPYDISIPVLGYNSAHFDMVSVIRYLTNPLWQITSYLKDFSHIKRVEVKYKITGVTLQLLDAMLFVTKGTLKQFVADFGNGGKDEQKGVFPYDAINIDNYNEILSKSEPFSKEDFNNELRKESITGETYQIYLEDSKQFKNKWDYLQYYNEQDTSIMIKPIENLIEMNFENGIEIFNYISMASCANTIKYKIACHDFDLNSRYINQNDSSFINFIPFNLTEEYWEQKVNSYKQQDLRAKRSIRNNVQESYFEKFAQLIEKGSCRFCKARFTNENRPTLDRIKNAIGHTKDNVRLACVYCNVARANRYDRITRLKIQLKRYYLSETIAENPQVQYQFELHATTNIIESVSPYTQ
ncbi:MAG: hypothetical protein EZS28_032873 [Streblomastix strix]|uniref:DNA-directed DNA polymerase n=1 Tax=Streblomastix strix TaxID=222440 RepID=A0A5J4UNP6_9EUKA|nr:MAG: hypothetical protein EZS28_032873 [Streblomastix strix]